MIETITIIGSGNVATQLAILFKKLNFKIVEIWSRNLENAQNLALKVDSIPISKIEKINTSSDLYLVAIADDGLKNIAKKIPQLNGIIAHTSGASSLNIFENQKNFGVFYPLQTFKKESLVNWKNIPILIEANNSQNLKNLSLLAQNINNQVFEISSQQRQYLHLSAVFACNFTNYLLYISQCLMEENNLDKKLLEPLIRKTYENALIKNPKDLQTGPAIRNDQKTIQKQINLLEKYSDFQELYKTISSLIFKMNQNANG